MGVIYLLSPAIAMPQQAAACTLDKTSLSYAEITYDVEIFHVKK